VITGDDTIDSFDSVAAVLFGAALLTEAAADSQQWNFHQRKENKLASDPDVRVGFLRSGLFSLSRHPNFAAEQTLWIIIWTFSWRDLENQSYYYILHPLCCGGALFLLQLFQGSTRLTEEISLRKYGQSYREYQESGTPMFWPLPSIICRGSFNLLKFTSVVGSRSSVLSGFKQTDSGATDSVDKTKLKQAVSDSSAESSKMQKKVSKVTSTRKRNSTPKNR